MPNGKKISFTTTAGGITLNKIYYVINTQQNTFQISLTDGGSAVTITSDGSMNIYVIPIIVTVNANDVVLDIPCSATGTVSLVAGVLKRSIALLKGWTITN